MTTYKPLEFGLASIKTEGYIMDYACGVSCDPLETQMKEIITKLSLPWYLKPFRRYVLRIAVCFWQDALLTKAYEDLSFVKAGKEYQDKMQCKPTKLHGE